MRISNRVTTTALNRNYGKSVNDVHSRLNKSMNKISSGKAYESASQNPLAYYEGQKIDNQYQDIESKKSLITDIQKRLEEQESGAYSIQTLLQQAQNKVIYIRDGSHNGTNETVETVRQDLMQKQQAMVNDLNRQYQDFYIFGGNDVSTSPFSLSADGKTLTFNHKFPGETSTTTMTMQLKDNGDGTYGYDISATDMQNILRAMREQGRVDVGYGTISNRSTLIDTYTGGLNVLTGLNSDTLNAMSDADAMAKIKERLDDSPIGLLGQGIMICDENISGGSKDTFNSKMGTLIDQMTVTHSVVGTVYSDIGNKWATLDTLNTKLKKESQSLQEQYKDKLGADPYEAITEMFSNQYSYSAALQLGSRLLQSSLFDFIS